MFYYHEAHEQTVWRKKLDTDRQDLHRYFGIFVNIIYINPFNPVNPRQKTFVLHGLEVHEEKSYIIMKIFVFFVV